MGRLTFLDDDTFGMVGTSTSDVIENHRNINSVGMLEQFHKEFPNAKIIIEYVFGDTFMQAMQWTELRNSLEISQPKNIIASTDLLKILSPLIILADQYNNYNNRFEVMILRSKWRQSDNIGQYYAAQMLIEKVIEEFKSKASKISPGDGFGVSRTIRNECLTWRSDQMGLLEITAHITLSDDDEVPFISII